MRFHPTRSGFGAVSDAASARARAGTRVGRFLLPVAATVERFRSARRGAVAIEFALVGMPFFLLICSIMMVGFVLFCTSTLDYATQRAARQIMVGTSQTASLTAAQFRTNVVCSSLPPAMFDCTKVVVDLKTVTESKEPTDWYDFVKPNSSSLIAPPTDNSQASFCMGAGNTYQVLRVVYPLPTYLAVFTTSPSIVQGQFIVQSTAAFKNEPFQGGTSSGC